MSRQDVHIGASTAGTTTVTPATVSALAVPHVPGVSSGSAPSVPTMQGVSWAGTHGGITDWDGYRAYNSGTVMTAASRGPAFLAYSESAANLGGTSIDYATILAHVKSFLDSFYYTGAAPVQTHSSRWGIKLFWSNGNENFNKGVLASHNPTTIAQYVTSQQALYDGCHYIDPGTGQRRYPDAFAGSNPTTFAEFTNQVADWLHPSARYHDFVMWSFYPPDNGRVDGDTFTQDWPSFNESDRTNNSLGFLIRCFYRTKQAEAQARIDRADPNYRIGISCGETGAGRYTTDKTERPYWAANGMWRGPMKLGAQYDLDVPFLCWWDQLNNAFDLDVSGTTPTTAQVWRNPDSYIPEYGGSKPASWASNPNPAWSTSGPVA